MKLTKSWFGLVAAVVSFALAGAAWAQAPKTAAAAADKPAAGPKLTDIELEDIKVGGVSDAAVQAMNEVEEGDHKEFKVTTDESLTGMAAGDIYKGQQAYFKIKSVKPTGKKGGTFVVERYRGKADPGNKWSRISGQGPVALESRQTLLDRYWAGGPMMHAISFCLLLGLLVILQCLFYLRVSVHCPEELRKDLIAAIDGGDMVKFEDMAMKNRGMLAVVAREMAADAKRLTTEEMKSRLESVALSEVGRLSFPIRIINFITVAAPLFGLLGTVTGMIGCFEALAWEGASENKAAMLSAGMKEALYTTAFGLLVAIPHVLMMTVFQHRVGKIANFCAVATEDLIHEIDVLRCKAEITGKTNGKADA